MEKRGIKFKFLLLITVLFLSLAFVGRVQAGNLSNAFGSSSALSTMASSSGYEASDSGGFESWVSLIIQTVLGLLGILFIILSVYAGITWMTAGGNEEKIKQATSTLRNNIIGLAITLLAYAISVFIISIFS